MAAPSEVVWSQDKHTAAKHQLLRRYLNALLPIQLTHKPRITYAEGFSGPGVYSGGEPGSPIVALECFAAHAQIFEPSRLKAADVILIEENPRRAQRLTEELAQNQTRLRLPPNVRVHPPTVGDCVSLLADKLNEVGAWGNPLFAFLDSFGGPDIPLSLVKQLAVSRYSEVLLTFAPSFLVRHGGDSVHTAKGDEAFGGTHWQGVFAEPSENKFGHLVEAYKTSLKNAGYEHSLAFVMVDEGGRQVVLLFGTNHPKGIEKMKDAMWGVDPVHGIRYRDPADPDQTLLDITLEPDLAPLRTILLRRIAQGPLSLENLRNYTNESTVYRSTHARTTALKLLSDSAISKGSDRILRPETTLSITSAGQARLNVHEDRLV